jgi:hypothetical protein
VLSTTLRVTPKMSTNEHTGDGSAAADASNRRNGGGGGSSSAAAARDAVKVTSGAKFSQHVDTAIAAHGLSVQRAERFRA